MLNRSVAILMCTYNGADYLKQQLQSFQDQTYRNLSLFVSDDGSDDETLSILDTYFQDSKFAGAVFKGPGCGFSKNFMSLVANTSIISDYYAFSDQDDVWLPDKIRNAVKWLDSIPVDQPALYCSRTILTDADAKVIGHSPYYQRPPSFRNALLQNIASGNTMIFNHKARELLASVAGKSMVAHDWSLYQIVTACGGHVFYDKSPTVLYRQHHNNVIGNSMGLVKRMENFCKAHSGRTAEWNNINFSVLKRVDEHMLPESQAVLRDFQAIRGSSFLKRIWLMKRSGIYHQQAIGCCSTLTYVLLNKI